MTPEIFDGLIKLGNAVEMLDHNIKWGTPKDGVSDFVSTRFEYGDNGHKVELRICEGRLGHATYYKAFSDSTAYPSSWRGYSLGLTEYHARRAAYHEIRDAERAWAEKVATSDQVKWIMCTPRPSEGRVPRTFDGVVANVYLANWEGVYIWTVSEDPQLEKRHRLFGTFDEAKELADSLNYLPAGTLVTSDMLDVSNSLVTKIAQPATENVPQYTVQISKSGNHWKYMVMVDGIVAVDGTRLWWDPISAANQFEQDLRRGRNQGVDNHG